LINIFDEENPLADTIIIPGACQAIDCFTITCELKKLGTFGEVIGVGTLTIDQLFPDEFSLFNGNATLDEDPEVLPYTCGIIVD